MNALGQIVWHALRQARWLPSTEIAPQVAQFAKLSPGDDVLPHIAAAWANADVNPSERRRGRRLQAWTHRQIASGSRLTIGPGLERDAGFFRWNGVRWVWWPRGIPSGTRVGLASSRLGRSLSSRRDWFRVFRHACAAIDRNTEVIATAATTTTHAFVRRAAKLFNQRMLLVVPPNSEAITAGWLDGLTRQAWPDAEGYEAHVSPVLPDVVTNRESPDSNSPLADRLLLTLADRVLLLYLRPSGRLLPLIKRRLADPAWQPGSLRVFLGSELVPRTIADELLAAGAVGCVVLGETPQTDPVVAGGSEIDCTTVWEASRILHSPPDYAEGYLTHCTRAANGAWPDQPVDEFLDELILGSASADHSALAALTRILTQQRILATSSAIRGGAQLVSFTAAPVQELSRLRTYRAHRGRWDFEPYGISIQRAALQRAGARPVLYGDEADWDRLSEADRPFFQRRMSENAKSGTSTDWSRECEWRVHGNVKLSLLDDHEAFAFVPSPEEARALLPHCRWPIVVLGATSETSS